MDTSSTPTSASEGKLPKRYIRTLEGDMNTFKSGGTPDLAPLKESQPSPAERLVEASPVAPAPIEAPAPAPEPTPTPVPAPTAPAKPTPIKTYSEDFRDRMKETHASTATVLAAEQDAGAAPTAVPVATEEPKSRTYLYIGAGVLLLLVGGIGVYVAYSRYTTATAPVVVAPVAATPIFVDSREEVSGVDTALQQAIKQLVAESLAPNTVRLLSLKNPANADTSVFSAVSTHAPGLLLRNIEASNSMAGIVNAGNAQSPFFILSVSSYGATFSGMLSWEPVMQGDLAALYPLYPAPPVVAVATSTSSKTKTATTTPTAPAPKIGFRDEVASNHDVRVYRDAQGRSVLLYGYWNQATLVIARDPAAFAEIIGRLATSHAR